MALVPAEPFWTALDDAAIRNGQMPDANMWRAPALTLNHVVKSARRVIFNQHMPASQMLAPSTDATSYYRYRFNKNAIHGGQLSHRVLALNLDSATTPLTDSPSIAAHDGTTYQHLITQAAAIVEAADFALVKFEAGYTPIDAYADHAIGVTDAFAPIALAIVERSPLPPGILNSTAAAVAEVAEFAPAAHVKADDPGKLATGVDAAWDTHRPVLIAWSAINTNAAGHARTNATTSPVNIIDGAAFPPASWNEPGWLTPCRYAGKGAGTTVRVNVAVYAQATVANNGRVRVMTDSSGTGDVTITVSDSLAWYEATTLTVRTDAEYGYLQMGFWNVAAGTLRVYAISGQVDPG